MSRKKFLYGIDGKISHIYGTSSATISFLLDNAPECAFLKKDHFYWNGRLLPEHASLLKYIRLDMQVKFSCHVLGPQKTDPDISRHYTTGWYVMMCWVDAWSLPHNAVSLRTGIYSMPCVVEKVSNRRGVVTTVNDNDGERRIELFASKFYLHGKRFPASKMLSCVLNKESMLFCDAVPCIEEESREQCEWFATCGFQGKRPSIEHPPDELGHLQSNHLVHGRQSAHVQSVNENNGDTHEDKNGQTVKYKRTKKNLQSQLINVINYHTSNSRALFTIGYGFILDILNDEFAIILGCIRRNVFQTILFHRRNAILFKLSLATSKLSEIFAEGDYVRFVATGAPENFFTSFIAVQVSVPEIENACSE